MTPADWIILAAAVAVVAGSLAAWRIRKKKGKTGCGGSGCGGSGCAGCPHAGSCGEKPADKSDTDR